MQNPRGRGGDGARRQQRRAQFVVDFIEAENSMGFHADQEAARVLAMSVNESRLGEAALRGGGATVTRSPVAPAQLVTPHGGGEGRERGGSGSP